MERKLVDVGHRVEPESGLVSDVTHVAAGNEEVGRTDALQTALKKAAASIGNGLHEGSDEVIAFARREPVTALTAAAGLGFVVGFALAMGSRSGAGRERAWLPQLRSSRTSFLGRRTGSGWRGFLRLQ